MLTSSDAGADTSLQSGELGRKDSTGAYDPTACCRRASLSDNTFTVNVCEEDITKLDRIHAQLFHIFDNGSPKVTDWIYSR